MWWISPQRATENFKQFQTREQTNKRAKASEPMDGDANAIEIVITAKRKRRR
jgi:hypothetical protein